MNEQERFFFKENTDGKYEFIDDSKKNICLQSFLAYHSYSIGNPEKDVSDSFLYLEFKSDREVYNSMINPEKFKDHLQWKPMSEAGDLVKNLEKPTGDFTVTVVKVVQEDGTDKIVSHKIRSFELYVEVPLPWIVGKTYNGGDKVAILTKYQKDLIDGGLKCDYNLVGESYEPIIVDEKSKYGLVCSVIQKLHMSGGFKEVGDKVVLLKIKEGDKGLMNANVKKCFDCEFVDVETFKDYGYYEKLKNPLPNHISVVVQVCEPGNVDKAMYYVTTSFDPKKLDETTTKNK